MGGTGNSNNADAVKNIEAMKYNIENGINLINTAEMYGIGHSEEMVGGAIADFPRDHLFIVTKFWNDHLKHDDLIRFAKNSLLRLKSRYIDLYLIH